MPPPRWQVFEEQATDVVPGDDSSPAGGFPSTDGRTSSLRGDNLRAAGACLPGVLLISSVV